MATNDGKVPHPIALTGDETEAAILKADTLAKGTGSIDGIPIGNTTPDTIKSTSLDVSLDMTITGGIFKPTNLVSTFLGGGTVFTEGSTIRVTGGAHATQPSRFLVWQDSIKRIEIQSTNSDADIIFFTSSETAALTINGVNGNATFVGTINGITPATSQYTSTLNTKLNGIETSADKTDSTNVLSSLSGQALSVSTLNTGQGANELYDMNQNVETTNNVTFAQLITTSHVSIGGAAVDSTKRLHVKSTTTSSSSEALECINSSNDLLFQVRGDGNIRTGSLSKSPFNNTIANAANMFVNSGGNFYKSTAGPRRFKSEEETLDDSYADKLLDLRPVWFRSNSENDNPLHSFYGLISEEVVEIDPRLVSWDHPCNQVEKEITRPLLDGEDTEGLVIREVSSIVTREIQVTKPTTVPCEDVVDGVLYKSTKEVEVLQFNEILLVDEAGDPVMDLVSEAIEAVEGVEAVEAVYTQRIHLEPVMETITKEPAVYEVVEMVTVSEPDTDADLIPDNVNYPNMIPGLINLAKRQKAQIDALTDRLDKLENK